jgi:hypothetical protein
MQNISISRYTDPKATGWAGYVQPEDRSWIVYVGLDGRPVVFLHRHPVTGTCLPDDPTEREVAIRELDEELKQGTLQGRTGMVCNGPPEEGVPLTQGETVFPLGVDGTGGVGVVTR